MYQSGGIGITKQAPQSIDYMPFKLDSAKLTFLQKLQHWWSNPQQTQTTKIISHPLNEGTVLCLLYFMLHKISNTNKQTNCILVVDTKARADFLLQATQSLQIRYREYLIRGQPITIASKYQIGTETSQLVFTTFRQFVCYDLLLDNIYTKMIVETSNYVRMIEEGFRDYITDTYLRRAYIEAIRIVEAYREHEKNTHQKPQLMASKPKSQQEIPEIISLVLKESNSHLRDGKENGVEGVRKVRKTFENKRQELLNQKDQMRDVNFRYFQQNELVLLSTIMYVLGFFSVQIQNKKIKNLQQFLEQFENKTTLKIEFLQNIQRYLLQIYQNCPTRVYPVLEQTYLHAFCHFISNIMSYIRVFPTQYAELFEIRIEKFPQEKKDTVIEESTACVMVACQQNSKIYLKIIKEKSMSSLITQNISCPQEYWHRLFKKRNNILGSDSVNEGKFFTKIYGLHVSKTPSNEDLNFSEKFKPDIETIKIKSCGVLLSELSKFIPDGIVVYFHSQEGLDSFIREMDKQEQKIIKKIDGNKKIFVESILEQQNIANYIKYKKCCEIGRGGMFLLSANSKAAQTMKFYHHLSRCIVFFGLPKREGESKKQTDVKRQAQNKVQIDSQKQSEEQTGDTSPDKIAIFNECLNNCINDIDDYKSVIFVGREITNDLSTWYKSFIKTWDETTRQSLPKLRSHFQKMAPINFN